MSYKMFAGQHYQLARSLRHEQVYALPAGVFSPYKVEIDEQTASEMEFAKALVYLDGDAVAVMIHPRDENFVLGLVIDPAENDDADGGISIVTVDSCGGDDSSSVHPTPTPAQMAEWGYEYETICEACEYYIRDHKYDGEKLICIE